MKKVKCLVIFFISIITLLIISNITKAAEITVSRDVYSNNGSMKFTFSGLTLDKTHEYEYGLTRTSAEKVSTWHLLTDYTENTAKLDISATTKDFREVINDVDTGYITIKDKTLDEIILKPYSVDLKIPFLKVTNYNIIPNGKNLDESNITITLRCVSNSVAYYQYEKITDEKVINKYKEIKASNGDITELERLLKTDTPSANWTPWEYWNGYDSSNGMNGFGYTQRNISAPDIGLYYMWVYFAGRDVKDIYGYILVDNLQPEIALESVSLPKTAKVELGETLTLTPTFNPTNATNKIVTWKSSDESVATVDNTGKITPKKVGSTIITITTEDGNKTASCTVTVTETSTNNGGGNNNNENGNATNNNDGKDDTTAPGRLPQTGAGIGMICSIVFVVIGSIIAYTKYKKYKGL